jgi:NTP pyrophosphatase (non-canonical NTP hydrolase)
MDRQLIDLVVKWADEKGILSKATPLAQANKTKEEAEELLEACQAQQDGLKNFTNSKGKLVNTREEVMDAIGDCLVTLIIQAEMQGVSVQDCLQSAYNVISKRTGVMKDGQFVKDEN